MLGFKDQDEELAPETDEEKLIHSIKLGILAMQQGNYSNYWRNKNQMLKSMLKSMLETYAPKYLHYYIYFLGDFTKSEYLLHIALKMAQDLQVTIV